MPRIRNFFLDLSSRPTYFLRICNGYVGSVVCIATTSSFVVSSSFSKIRLTFVGVRLDVSLIMLDVRISGLIPISRVL